MRGYVKYIKRAKELGAKQAKVISAKTIVVAEWVRLKCKFGCSGYGQCLTCPPHSPAPDETRRVLGYYKYALLVHGNEYADIHGIIPILEREIFLDGYFKAFGMGAGPCELCAKKAYQLGIKKIYYIDPYPGISLDHIFQSGTKRPVVELFSGALGRAHHQLYTPIFPYKDEQELLYGDLKGTVSILEDEKKKAEKKLKEITAELDKLKTNNK